jgi:hypothetical protein
MAASGASVTVSHRGEYIEGTKNRLVTVEGSSLESQAAYALLNELLNESS